MNKFNLASVLKTSQVFLSKHSPEILTGIGIAGMISTTVLAVKATPQALDLIKADSRLAHDGDPYAYTKTEAVKSCWKCYIPAAVTGTVSVACLIGASSVNVRRNAALAMAYQLSETTLAEYREKVVETIGEKKEQTVRDKMAKDKIEKHPVKNTEVIITGNGETLCYDYHFGRYFKSDRDKIVRAINELNRRMTFDNDVSLNDFYYEIGLDGVEAGDHMGWHIDNGLIEPSFSSQLADNGTPCLVLSFVKPPRYEYC